MKNLAGILLVLSLFLFCGSVSGQSTPHETLLDHMTGKWVLRGTIAGQKTVHDVNIQWVLGRGYLQIREVSRELDKGGHPQYEAIVYLCLEQPSGEYACLWLDNTGNGGLKSQAIGRAKPKDDRIELLFQMSDNSRFFTTFAYNKDSQSWQWLMDGEEKGVKQPFARLEMTRK
ncbi:MAG: hypothetical protein LWW85_00975 [Marinilabiliales bacterium]|nr:hypothetical protein [Marinilabiliales bacterium]